MGTSDTAAGLRGIETAIPSLRPAGMTSCEPKVWFVRQYRNQAYFRPIS